MVPVEPQSLLNFSRKDKKKLLSLISNESNSNEKGLVYVITILCVCVCVCNYQCAYKCGTIQLLYNLTESVENWYKHCQ